MDMDQDSLPTTKIREEEVVIEIRAYVDKTGTSSSGGVSTGQNRETVERTIVCATTTAAYLGATQLIQVGSSSEADIAGRKKHKMTNLI
jgi:hypothetical protein